MSESTNISPDLQASLICDDIRQEMNGKFFLIGLFDVVGVPSFPAVFQRICVVNRWCCGMGEFKQRNRLIATDGNSILIEGREVAVNLPVPEANATCVEFFMNVRFEKEGTYWIEVLLDGDLKLRYPLRVQQVQMAQHQKPRGNA